MTTPAHRAGKLELTRFRHWLNRWRRRDTLTAYLFLAPWLIGLLFFYIGPVIAAIYYSLTDYSIISSPKFVGLKNYRSLIEDSQVVSSMKATLTYTVFSLITYVVISLFLALLANKPGRGVGAFRLLVFLPSIIPLFAAGVLWGWLFNTDFGLVNYVLNLIGLPSQGFFQSPSQALTMVIVISLWGLGSSFLVYLSGLQSIPTDLYEAIRIDGAGMLRRFWHVTLPMLSPVILFNLVIGVVLSFQVFDISWVLTRGGPADSTLFWVLLIYRRAFEEFRMGYASALAVVFFVAVVTFTGLIFRTSRWWVHYEGRRS